MMRYEYDLPLATVSAILVEARRELWGQVPEPALPELLLRLADNRLAALRG